MIKYLLDRLVFGAGLLAGFQLPKFIGDYRQRVGGMLDQARLQLQQFQAIADRHHGGSLPALIDMHRTSENPSFRAEGLVIQQLADQVAALQATYEALAGAFGAQLRGFVTHFDPQIARSTFEAFQPGLVLSWGSAVCALLFAFTGSLLVIGLARLVPGRRHRTAPAPARRAVPAARAEPTLLPIREPQRRSPPGR